MQRYQNDFSTKKTPQSQAIPGKVQVKNSAGGFAFEVDNWTKLDRFLILGTEGGSYYAGQSKMTKDSANAVLACINEDGLRVVRRVKEISTEGRAPKNDPAIFVLAMCSKLGDLATRQAAYGVVNDVCRIGTHLFHYAEYCKGFGGWGRGMRRAVSQWYNEKDPQQLAYQLVKYQQRDGWSHRDMLRLSHPQSEQNNQLYRYVTKGGYPPVSLIHAVEQIKTASVKQAEALIREYNIPRECVPTKHLTNPAIWEALLERMPMTAMIRNLGNMSKCGLVVPFADATKTVVKRLNDKGRLTKSRIHPLAVLSAMKVYEAGKGVRGKGSWAPVSQVVDALDSAFYKTFKNVEPTNKNTLIALDISASMTWSTIGGVPGVTPRVASAALALVTAATEPNYGVVAFASSSGDWPGGISPISISPRQRLTDVLNTIDRMRMGGTDCALPMIYALENELKVDTFVVYTDNETWAGYTHPCQALNKYRRKMNRPAKLVVVGMLANKFSIADPDDAGMLDVVGFDTATPKLISEFSAGETLTN